MAFKNLYISYILLVYSNPHSSHFWQQTSILIPISIVLMPDEGSTRSRGFHHQLKVNHELFVLQIGKMILAFYVKMIFISITLEW